MKVVWIRVSVALCAFLLCAGNTLAEEPLGSDVSEKKADAMPLDPLKMPEDMGMEVKENEAMMKGDEPHMELKVDKEDSDSPMSKDLPVGDDDANDKQEPEKMDEMPENPVEEESETEGEKEKEAEILAQPGMRRLARYLRNFHGRQIFRANAQALAAQRAASVSDEDEDAIAEERAVRRRKRVRRRNTKNKVKRRHNNRHVANRKKTSRRKLNSRSSSKRKNTNRTNSRRKVNRKNSRVQRVHKPSPSRRRSGLRRGSTAYRRPARKGTRKGPSKRATKRKQKNKKSKKTKKGKKQKKKNRRNKKQEMSRDQDSSSARKDDNNHQSEESHEDHQNVAESPAA